MYEIIFKKKAGKELAQLPKADMAKVAHGIDGLATEPRPSGSKKLKDSEEDMWRIRVGNYRVLYVIDDGIRIVSIRKIGHRKDVYRG